ncbi:MAG TPA: hypothetical protein VMU09_07300, partial [Acidimicrobiales bacterium]|nr:hypothetical protein [Acidimicrobiales bacterium]
MRQRRIRALVLLTVVVLFAILLATCLGSGGSTHSSASSASSASTSSTGAGTGAPSHHGHTIAAAESGLLPWKLQNPLSREILLAGSSATQLVILGGLTAGGSSAQGVYTVDTTSGKLAHVGNLTAGLHDSSGAVVGNQDVAFGGGSPATVATVQAIAAPGATPGPLAAASAIGTLPQPRSDSATATVGTTTYVVGGYDGTNPDPAVLATTDGHSYSTVASLPVPVRYPAVAAVGGVVYAFGGQAVTGTGAGQPVDAIQAVNLAHRTATVVGHLPMPLEAAVAVTLGTQIYLAGGDSSVAQSSTTGVGTTQLGPPPAGANKGAGASSATTTAMLLPGGSQAGGAGTRAVLTASSTSSTSSTGSTGGAGSGETSSGTSSVSTIWAFDPTTSKVLTAGRLQVPISHSAAAVLGTTAWLVGGESNGTSEAVVQMITPNSSFGVAGQAGAGSPYYGYKLLVADRGNNRFLVMDPAMNVLWTYPNATSPPDPLGFNFPDDAFFMDKGRAIISNQEQNNTIIELAYPSGKVIWSYGHPKQTGTSPGYLSEPDDAYVLKNGQVTVADANNCRVVIINHDGTVAGQIGTNGKCLHNPPTSMGSPNGDTPLPDGNTLVSEITGSWISEYTLQGKLVWTVHAPVVYPSDPQQLASDLYLVADY